MSADARGWKVALVPEAWLRSPRSGPGHDQDAGATELDPLRLLEAAGCGILAMPPAGDHRLLLAVIADQVAEYAHHCYAIAGVGLRGVQGGGLHWHRFVPMLRRRGVAPPPRHLVDARAGGEVESRRLGDFLAALEPAALALSTRSPARDR